MDECMIYNSILNMRIAVDLYTLFNCECITYMNITMNQLKMKLSNSN